MHFTRMQYNHPITGVTWPPCLQKLEFGDGFNQPVVNVVWPDSMRELEFGDAFDQSTDLLNWPDSLRIILSPLGPTPW